MVTRQRQPGRKAINPGNEVASSEGKFVPSVETGLVEIAPALLGKASGVRSILSWVIGLLGLLALILAVLHFGSLERTMGLARSAHPAWLFLAVLVQAATYASAALVWRQALHRAGYPRSLRTLIPLGIAKLFTDQVLPSGGISGTMLVVSGLIRRRVPPKVAMAAMPAIWVVFVSFAIATIGPIPVGLGTFEAGSVGILSYLGVSIEAALAGTLLLRGPTFWLPMLPGIWLARREIGRM